MIVRELFAKLGLEVDEAAFKAGDAALAALKGGLLAIGGAVTAAAAALAGVVKATESYASQVHDLALQTGISAETLQVLGYAGKLAGVSMEEVAHGLAHLSRNAFEASTSGGAAGEAFYRLGIDAYDASGKVKGINDLLPEVSAALNKIQNPTEKTALSMQLLGRGGARLTQTFAKFGGDMEKIRKEAVALGIVLDDKVIDAGDDLGDSLDRISFAIKGVVYAIGVPLLGRVRVMAERFVHWIEVNRKFIALRVHEAISHVTNALQGLYTLGKEIAGHPALLKWLVGIGIFAALALAPILTLSLALAAIAEDLYLFFSNPKADTLTRDLVKYFKKLGEEMDKIGFFTALYREGKKFADWFANEVVDALARSLGAALNKSFPAPRPAPGQAVINSQPPATVGQGMSNLLGNLFGVAPPQAFAPAIQPLAPRDAGFGVLAPQFQFKIEVNAGMGADGKQIGEELGPVLRSHFDRWADDYFGNILSDAQAATNR